MYDVFYREATSKIVSGDLSGWRVLYETALVVTSAWEFVSQRIIDEVDDDILVDETLELTDKLPNLLLLSLQSSFHESAEMLRHYLNSVSRSEDARAYFLETNAMPFRCWLVLTMHGTEHALLSDCDFGIYQDAAEAVKSGQTVSSEYLRSLCDWHLANNEDTDEGEYQVFRHLPFNFLAVEIYLLNKALNQRGQRLPEVKHELLDTRFVVPDILNPVDHRDSLPAKVAAALGARSILKFLSQ